MSEYTFDVEGPPFSLAEIAKLLDIGTFEAVESLVEEHGEPHGCVVSSPVDVRMEWRDGDEVVHWAEVYGHAVQREWRKEWGGSP